jgi:hypothetical protein
MRFIQRRVMVNREQGSMDGTVVRRFGNVSFVNGLKKTYFASWSRGDLAKGVCMGGGAF